MTNLVEKKLNKEQLEAVKYNPPTGGGPLLIIAEINRV